MGDSAVTDSEIKQAAKETFGCHDANISEHTVSERAATQGDDGVWVCLSIQSKAGADFEVVGRRRNRADLMKFAKRGPAQPNTAN